MGLSTKSHPRRHVWRISSSLRPEQPDALEFPLAHREHLRACERRTAIRARPPFEPAIEPTSAEPSRPTSNGALGLVGQTCGDGLTGT